MIARRHSRSRPRAQQTPTPDDASGGLICAYLLDGDGGGRLVSWDEILRWSPADGPLWVHLSHQHPNTLRWLEQDSAVPEVAVEAITDQETRPRAFLHEEAMVALLRGVNLNPGADPDDMVSLRTWSDGQRLISVRLRHLMAVEDVREKLADGAGPATIADLLTTLADRLVDRVQPTIDRLDEELDRMEDDVLGEDPPDSDPALVPLRRQAIRLRRYMAPMREALATIAAIRLDWIDADDRARLREIGNDIQRHVESLEAIRERAQVIQDELSNRLSQRMEKTNYVLTLVAAVFLPLGFLTGLFGINVGGMPGVDWSGSFAVVTLGLVLLVAAEVALLRRLKWL